MKIIRDPLVNPAGQPLAAFTSVAIGLFVAATIAVGDDRAGNIQSAVRHRDAPAPTPVPQAMADCALCHRDIVHSYLGHGMSRSIGPVGRVTPGVMDNPTRKVRYEISADDTGGQITVAYEDGGIRRQRLVGRIGAGIFATSWVGAEVHPETGATTGRLFFAPVETVTGHGLRLAPFELYAGSRAFGHPLTRDCLTCHTLDDPGDLPGAAQRTESSQPGDPYPPNHLGADAFEHMAPISCSACHGDVVRHPKVIRGRIKAPKGDIGLRRIGELEARKQLDICARCHLQGDVRIELVNGVPDPEFPIAGQIPVLTSRQPTADFRFVGQLERLALSECFKASTGMTCTSCHQPHTSVAAQTTPSFDAACMNCHRVEVPHTELTVVAVTGQPARSEAGCVDCHVRRSQPFDLPHVRSVDHFIQRRIRLPEIDIPHRQFSDREGELQMFADERLQAALETAAGRRWRDGITAIGLFSMGRMEEALELYERFPPPGSDAARKPGAPPGLTPLETSVLFHHVRALLLMSQGEFDSAKAAFGDALAIDPHAANARLGRARLKFDTGDIAGALIDTRDVIETYPRAEQPWDLRLEMAERYDRPDLAAEALSASINNWPSNATNWLKYGILLRAGGANERADQAFEQVRLLQPSLIERRR